MSDRRRAHNGQRGQRRCTGSYTFSRSIHSMWKLPQNASWPKLPFVRLHAKKSPFPLLGSPSSEKSKVDGHLSNTIGHKSHVGASRHAGVYESYLDTWSRLQRRTVTRQGSFVLDPALASSNGTFRSSPFEILGPGASRGTTWEPNQTDGKWQMAARAGQGQNFFCWSVCLGTISGHKG